jgi:hypothetical protein
MLFAQIEVRRHTMAGLIRTSLALPEETRPLNDGKGELEVVNLESEGHRRHRSSRMSFRRAVPLPARVEEDP